MMDVLASETWKLRTIRSTWYILAAIGAIVALSILAGWNISSRWDGLTPQQREIFGFAPLITLASSAASLCLGVLGVLAITTEYDTGTIQVTLTAVPKRRIVLAAKAVAITAAGAMGGFAVAFGALFASRLVAGQPPLGTEIPLLLATGLSVTMFALMGLGFGAILRSATGALGVVVGLLYLLPTVAQSLQSPWNEIIVSLMPSALAGQLAGSVHGLPSEDTLLSPLGALGLMAAYAVGPLAAAAVLIVRRDA